MTRTRHDRPTFQLRLVADRDVVLGPGKVDLLAAIAREGSITAASRALNMSYKKAWQLIETMNRHFPSEVIATSTGGSTRGGAELTPLGEALLARYRALERRLAPEACDDARALLELMTGEAPEASS